MTTLRVHLAAAPAPGDIVAWALFDDAGGCIRTGRSAAATWPVAERVEAVVAASQVRIASVALPPLPPGRVAAAARFAVEDQLAGPSDTQHLAVSRRLADGRVRVVIAARSLVAALREARAGPAPRFARVIAEPDLAVPNRGWRWCAATPDGSDGFVRTDDGGAFPVSVDASGALPAELALALAQAQRDGSLPVEIRLEREATDAELARWQRDAGVAIVRGAPWRWTAAPPAAFGDAVDLLQGDFALTPPAPRGSRARLFAPALALAAAALAVHVVATVGEWGSLRVDAWRAARAWRALAADAGIPPDAAATPAAARAALAQRYAELRHAHGLAAPDDALPLLARAAPALRALPAGSVKTATYADGHWTLDLARADAAAVEELDARLRQSGVPALLATTAAGVRVRLGAL
ncbi:MAG TPA: type II secretion system protein GspL [Casimicrobiaceae bacterium]|nr:type II secretion system protein GspL [Casimicrobiaceae bacterium]